MQQPCALLLLLLLPTVLGRPVQVPFDASHVRVDSGGALQRPASGGVAAEGTFGQIPAVEGDSWMMSIAIPELYAGRYALNVTALTGPAQGTVQIRVNGTTIGTFNGYAEAVALQTQHVGAVHLEGGIYELGGVVTSKDERSQGFAFHCATVDFQREHQVRRRLQQPASSCTAKPAAVAAAAEMCNATAQGVDEGLCSAAALNGSAAACTSVGRCTYTAAVAAVAGYSCTQPAANATTCRESQDCVFTPASSGGAGSCALTDSAACAAALSADVDGSTCRALKCIYTGPAAGPASSDGEWIHCRRAIAQLTVTQMVQVGSSNSNTKLVSVADVQNCVSQPLNEQLDTWHDQFEALVSPNSVTVRRLDAEGGWEQPLVISCNVYQPEKPTHFIGANNEQYVCDATR